MEDLLKEVYYFSKNTNNNIGEISALWEEEDSDVDGDDLETVFLKDYHYPNNYKSKNTIDKYKFYIKSSLSENTDFIMLSVSNPEKKENKNHINGVHDFFIIKEDRKDICILTVSSNIFYFHWIEEPQNLLPILKKDLHFLFKNEQYFCVNKQSDLKAFGNQIVPTTGLYDDHYNNYFYRRVYETKPFFSKKRDSINFIFLEEIKERVKIYNQTEKNFLYDWNDSISNSMNLFEDDEIDFINKNNSAAFNHEVVYAYKEIIQEIINLIYLKNDECDGSMTSLLKEINKIIKFTPTYSNIKKSHTPIKKRRFVFNPKEYGSHSKSNKDESHDYSISHANIDKIFRECKKGNGEISASKIKAFLEENVGYFTPKEIIMYFYNRGFDFSLSEDCSEISLSNVNVKLDYNKFYMLCAKVEFDKLLSLYSKFDNDEDMENALLKLKGKQVLTDTYDVYNIRDILDDINYYYGLIKWYEEEKIEEKKLIYFYSKFIKNGLFTPPSVNNFVGENAYMFIKSAFIKI